MTALSSVSLQRVLWGETLATWGLLKPALISSGPRPTSCVSLSRISIASPRQFVLSSYIVPKALQYTARPPLPESYGTGFSLRVVLPGRASLPYAT